MQVIKFASATGFPVLVPPFLLDTLWSILLKRKFELIVRVSLHDGGLPRWFGHCTGTWNLTLSVPGLSDALGLSNIENLFTVLISIPPHHDFEKMLSNGSPRTCRELSTIVRWLSYVDNAWLVGLRDGSPRACSSALHIQLMLESVLSLYFLAVMMLEVMYQTSLTSKRSSINPGTTIANGFTCNRRRKSACWTNSWQVFPNICRSKFGEDIADLCIDCVDVQWLLALVGIGNPSGSPRRSSWTTPRTWMAPCQGWSSLVKVGVLSSPAQGLLP